MSKAFEKSNETTMTYGLTDRRSMTVLSRVIIAAVVDPVGRKANWSEKFKVGGGDWSAGYMYCLTNWINVKKTSAVYNAF